MSIERPGSDGPTLLDRIRDARFADGVRCPRCGGRHVVGWGSFLDRRRYGCKKCGRTFSDLTGTPAAYTKKLPLWSAYAEFLAQGASIRRVAKALGIATSTSFRWRHAIFDELRADDRATLSGVVEIRDLWFAHSRKGERDLDRPARTRGPRSRVMFPGRVIRVIVACDRQAGVFTDLALTPIVRVHDLLDALQERVAEKSTIVAAQGRLGPASRFARVAGARFFDVRRGVEFRPGTLWHLRTSLAYSRRLMGWMRRFRGVATKYLTNYLIWHRIVDAHDRREPTLVVLRWGLTTGFT